MQFKDSVNTCSRCLMDSTADSWKETSNGCNYCDEFLNRLNSLKKFSRENLDWILKEASKVSDSDFDCVIGLSGGIDSSYALHLVVASGLRPYVVNVSNSWDSELAQKNIERLVEGTHSELYTEVLDWIEFRSLQEAMFRSDIVDIELLTDHAINAILVKKAREKNVPLIITGSNYSTEGLTMPLNWAIPDKRDVRLIKDINRKFGTMSNSDLKFPFYSIFDEVVTRISFGIRKLPILNYFQYNKNNAAAVLADHYGYVPYSGKHYESVFTRLYQNYFLYSKHGVDKRKNHFSSLILTHQMSREQAMFELSRQPFEYAEFEEDKEYFLRKFNWSEEKLKEYLDRPGQPYSKFKNTQFRANAQVKKRLKS